MFTKIPVYGQLINSDRDSLKAAGVELLIATMFSLLPIWLYPIIVRVGFAEEFWQHAKEFVENGEFFLFSSALVGPLIYSITKKYGEEGTTEEGGGRFPHIKSIQFPYGFWFVIISVFTCVFSAIFFGLMRANTVNNFPINLDRESLFAVSTIMYGFTLSCFFCVSVYRLNLENTTRAFGEDTKDLMKQWEHEND
ncbi:hypothetical protein [Zhengella mangrovi]|nr:hypothetical protein [Zhengella mangrovi]